MARLVFALILAVAVLVLLPEARADGFCQCTQYVSRRYRLKWWKSCPTCIHASQLGPGLVDYYHWKQTDTPKMGDIVIFQPGSYPLYINGLTGYSNVPDTGHIAVVVSVGLVIAVRGANQGCSGVATQCNSACFTAFNCTNVSNVKYYYIHPGMSFYTPPPATAAPHTTEPPTLIGSAADTFLNEESASVLTTSSNPSLTIVTEDVTPSWVAPVLVAVSIVAALAIAGLVAMVLLYRRSVSQAAAPGSAAYSSMSS